MNIVCEQPALLKHLSIALNAVSERSTVEALKNFKLEGSDSNLIITTNNLETNIICSLNATVKEEGKVLVHARTFYNIISKLPGKEVTLSLSNENTLTISSGQSKFNIYTANVNEFPENMSISNFQEIKMNKDIFQDINKRVSFAASEEDEKVILNGVLMEMKKDKGTITFVSADGYRLAKDEIKFKIDSDLTTIIPIKTIKEISNILANCNSNDFSLNVSDDRVQLSVDDISLYSRVINGKFPDYTILIPSEYTVKYKINRKDYLDASERINIIAQKNSYMVKNEIVDQNLVVSSITPDFGDGSEVLSIDLEGTKDINIVFNVKLLIEVLKKLDSEFVIVEVIDGEKPIVIKEDNNHDYIYIMMPIKVRKDM
jgi:DNA polymerase III subunit beta